MCFHNSLSVESQTLENRYNARLETHSVFKPVYHASAFNHPSWPVITNENRNILQLFSWGLIPDQTANIENAFKLRQMTLNARVESLSTKKSFAAPAKQKRCLVPSTGFFEWQAVGKQKIPWFITSEKDQIFSIAGVWDTWNDPSGGTIYQTFSIVTTSANPFMEKIHNTKKRMPLILNRENEEEWLASDLLIQRSLDESSCKSVLLSAHTVSPLVGSKKERTDVPEVQNVYFYSVDGTLF